MGKPGSCPGASTKNSTLRSVIEYGLLLQVNSALHPSGVAKSSTGFGWGKGGNVTSAGWQVTPCDPMWHVSSRSGVATLRTAIHLLLTYLLLRFTFFRKRLFP